MKTCVVAITGIAHTDNFKHLPMVFHEAVDNEEVRFVIHQDPVTEYRSHRKEANYDLLLDLRHHDNDPEADYSSNRLSKMEQAVVLSQIVSDLGIKRFVKIPVLNKRPNPQNMYDMVDLPAIVLIKSCDGARGVGHVVFDTTRASIFRFIHDLKGGATPSGENDYENIMARFKDVIEVHTGQHHYDNEVYETLTTHDLMITPIVSDVIAEVRVLTDAMGKPVLFKRRTRVSTVKEGTGKGTGYQQATGANRDSASTASTLKDAVPSTHTSHVDDIEKVLSKLPPLNSVDLFFTTNGWGIFEYCTQFGTEAFEHEDLVELHTGFIAKLYKDKFPKPKKDI